MPGAAGSGMSGWQQVISWKIQQEAQTDETWTWLVPAYAYFG
jgi:hypothetical protein